MRTRLFASFVLVSSLLAACNRSAPAPADSASKLDDEAEAAAMAEIQKHYAKSADGWTSAIITGVSVAPEHVLRQFREITIIGVDGNPLSDADRLNGVQWTGEVSFKAVPAREAGDTGVAFEGANNMVSYRQKGRWTQWFTVAPSTLRLQKVNGQWHFAPDQSLLRGNPPGPADYKAAGVQ